MERGKKGSAFSLFPSSAARFLFFDYSFFFFLEYPDPAGAFAEERELTPRTLY